MSLFEPGSDSYASERNEGYRRGFVLGLTLAEAALLLVFVILLLLVVGFERRNAEIRKLAAASELLNSVAEPGESLSETTARVSQDLTTLAQLREASGVTAADWDDDFVELIKATAELSRSKPGAELASELAAQRDRLERAARLAEGISDDAGLQEAMERLAELEYLTSNQSGQLRELLGRLTREGRGGDLPSCWTTTDGRPDYLLQVSLESGGLRVSESISDQRAAERGTLPIDHFEPAVVHSEVEFLEKTSRLFKWSVEHECRFYVDVFDATGSSEKGLYKSRLRAVEGHFYKRHRDGNPPF